MPNSPNPRGPRPQGAGADAAYLRSLTMGRPPVDNRSDPMSTAKTVPTPAEIREQGARVKEFILSHRLVLEATIDDYPIGRRERGRCRIAVERAKGKGYRTIKQTTDRSGRWCNPKKSTYGDACRVVVDDLAGDRPVRWLSVGDRGVFLTAPNGDGEALIEAPYWCKPRRTAQVTRWKVTTVRIHSGEAPTEQIEEHTHAADPPELCDAYDAWMEVYAELRTLVAGTYDRP
jgi:hypothetical protein